MRIFARITTILLGCGCMEISSYALLQRVDRQRMPCQTNQHAPLHHNPGELVLVNQQAMLIVDGRWRGLPQGLPMSQAMFILAANLTITAGRPTPEAPGHPFRGQHRIGAGLWRLGRRYQIV